MKQATIRLDDYDTDTRFAATVVTSERITSASSDEDVRELVLDVDRPDFSYQVGQSIGIFAPGARQMGQQHHFRLYSVADLPERIDSGRPRIKICVRRCFYLDDYSGERYKGIASNYLCDLKPGNSLTISGPFGIPFEVPEELDANIILIGSGTGIAPFRAFVKHIFANVPDWNGRIWLFHGARSGLELLYMNDERDDFAQYYDRETFEAFQALSRRPAWGDPIDWGSTIAERGEELWDMLSDPKTYVYVAGLEAMHAELDGVFENLAGSESKWERRKAELQAGRRWVELVY
ncbi:MAG: ferredoxin-NADP reductase [Deltaproteobacteria bacterium]|nr:ferredoxin-NADP reductase [Deltaproteobacteria bacterium]